MLAGCLWPGAERLAMPRHDERRQSQDALPARAQHVQIVRIRVVGRPACHPPKMCEGDNIVRGRRQRRDVLWCVARRRDQLNRGREVIALGGLVNPQIAVIDRLKIVDARVGKERGVHRVVGMMMRNDDIGDGALRLAQRRQRAENVVPVGHHARINNHPHRAITDVGDGGGDVGAVAAPTNVASGQDVYLRRACKLQGVVIRIRQVVSRFQLPVLRYLTLHQELVMEHFVLG